MLYRLPGTIVLWNEPRHMDRPVGLRALIRDSCADQFDDWNESPYFFGCRVPEQEPWPIPSPPSSSEV